MPKLNHSYVTIQSKTMQVTKLNYALYFKRKTTRPDVIGAKYAIKSIQFIALAKPHNLPNN